MARGTRWIVAMVTLAGAVLVSTSAQAVIKIEQATVQNGVAFVKGNGAAPEAAITWEGFAVATANKRNGGFSFFSVLPGDCSGQLSDGVSTVAVAVVGCKPVMGVPAPVPRTGQTTSYAQRDDGALQVGVPLPNPRVTDNGDGTITDNLTGLIWLKNANCPLTPALWPAALNYVVELNTVGKMNGHDCGDRSNAGSHQTDWRLPNIRELLSLLDYGRFPVIAGGENDTITLSGSGFYWSSTSSSEPFLGGRFLLCIEFIDGTVELCSGIATLGGHSVIAVRGGLH